MSCRTLHALVLGTVLASLCVLSACGGEEPSQQASDGQDAADAKEAERLRSLPYLGFTSKPGAEGKRGVVHHDRDRSYAGYNLYSNHALCSAELIDNEGKRVRVWKHPGRHWSHCELLPDGDLLVTGTDPVGDDDPRPADTHRFIMRFSWDGELLWKRVMPAHHDVQVMPDGRLLTLTARKRDIPAINTEIRVRDNGLALLTSDGRLIEEKSLYDIFAAKPGGYTFQSLQARPRRGEYAVVLFHNNSVQWIDRPDLAGRHVIYAPGNVLTCSRNQDAIFVVNWERGEFVWTWGQGVLSGPHDAKLLENGNILVFDNGIERRWSRVLELDPLTEEVVWEYRAPNPEAFFTVSRGSSQRLPNGNTLIANSDSGHAFEVTPGGETVWEFWNPNSNDKGERGTIVRIERYEIDYIDRILAHQTSGP
jgi:hypothetical protein